MKRLKLISCCAAMAAAVWSCSRSGGETFSVVDVDQSSLHHDEIVLGNQLDNPYAVSAVKAALSSLYPSKAAYDVNATHLYVRFLPSDDEQLSLLYALGLTLVDHPVDYEIVRDGDYYHDPTVGEENITWQYAVVPVDFVFPSGVRYEELDRCFIGDSVSTRAKDGIDWEAVEREAFRLTGNESMLEDAAATKAGGVQPTGRITIVDADANGGQPFGVAGVKVECNVFVKFSSACTDRDGYYTIPKKFSANPRYRLVFKNTKGFSIGMNMIIYPASVSTLGKNSPGGINLQVDRNSERKLFRRCAANNAAYEYFTRCEAADLGIDAPPSDLSFWMFDSLNDSDALMLHHGTVLDREFSNIYFKIAALVVQLFGPDVYLGTQNATDYKGIYTAVVHQMALASHFQRVGKGYWDKYVLASVESAIRGLDLCSSGSLTNAGYCGMSQMWAFYLCNRMLVDRYGGQNPGLGSEYWFHPQILGSLEDRGFSPSEIFAAFKESVTGLEALRQELISLYPEKSTLINQVFNRYE